MPHQCSQQRTQRRPPPACPSHPQVPEAEISAVAELPVLLDLPKAQAAELPALLAATAVLKLNGGLGTSMGLEKAKSLLPVKDGNTFLDLIAKQVGALAGRQGRGRGGRGAGSRAPSWQPGGAARHP